MAGDALLGSWAPAPGLGVVDRREAFAACFCQALAAHSVAADSAHDGRGWLRLPDAPVVADPTASVPASNAQHAPDARPVVFIPGMFGECVAPWTTPFSDAHALLRARGHSIHVLDVEGRSSSARNGRIIDQWMGEHAGELEDAVLVAYSKGATDFMHGALLDAGPRRWLDRIGALVTVCGVVNGTPLAAGWSDHVETLLSRIDIPSCAAGDGGAVDSQEYAQVTPVRDAYLALGRLPATFAVTAVTDDGSVNPLLAAFHEHLAERDPRNDGQVLLDDSLLPGSQLLAVARADHWSIALPFETSALPLRLLGRNNHFPRVALLVALLAFIGGPDRSQPVAR